MTMVSTEGPCFMCGHAVSQVIRGYCPKFEKTVRAMDGCSDFSATVVHYTPAEWITKLSIRQTDSVKGKPDGLQTP